METVKEINKKMVESEIKMAIASGKYKNIDDLIAFNPDLNKFCLNHKLNYIMHSFSTQFTNDDYLKLLNTLKKEMKFADKKGQLIETNVNGQIFLDKKDEQSRETLVGVDEVQTNGEAISTFNQEKKNEKREARFLKITDIDLSKIHLNQNQMTIYRAIMAEPDPLKYEIYFDEFDNMTNIIRDNEVYYTVENKNGQVQFTKYEGSEKGKQTTKQNNKVLTLSNGHNILSDGFANVLILSFIIGSFFGIIFLAIYSKIMY